MKKILVLLSFLVVGIMPACADTIKVESLSDFTTENPPETLTVKAVTDLNLDDELLIFEGYTLKGDIVDVVSPKRLKRDASFAFILTEYTDNDGIVHKVERIDNKIVKGKFTTKFDYKSVAKSAALSVGNYFVKGLSMGYAAVEGAVKNEEGNRFKSSAVSVYESTPLSYVEKGEDIVIAKDQVFILNFKLRDEKDLDEEEISENEEPVDETFASPETSTSSSINDSTKLDNVSNEKQVSDIKEETSVLSETPAAESAEERNYNTPISQPKNESQITQQNDAVEYEEHDGFHLRRRTKKYPPEMENQTVPDTSEPMSVPDPVNNQPLAPLELPDTY